MHHAIDAAGIPTITDNYEKSNDNFIKGEKRRQ
jgi:hypothetical protein